MEIQKIKKISAAYQQRSQAPLGFAFYDLESGEQWAENGEKAFPTASAFKIFVLTELFRMAERGELSMDQRITLEKDDIAGGSGILLHFDTGCALTVRDYCYLMIGYSDNTATDILMKIATPEKIRADILEPFGFAHTKLDFNCKELLHYAYSIPAPDGETYIVSGKKCYRNAPYFTCETEKNLQSTPEDMLRCLRLIAEGKFGSEETTQGILGVLKNCATNQRIPRLLPPGVAVAHKTGSLNRVCNDMGIVYTKKGAYILVLFYNGNCATREVYNADVKHCIGETMLAELSREIYDAYLEE